MSDHTCGSIHTSPPSVIADRCARWILEVGSARAVTLDPEGRVCVEFPGHAAESDLVGVYTPSLGLLGLSRWIAEDLRVEVQAHRARPKRRVVVSKRRAA